MNDNFKSIQDINDYYTYQTDRDIYIVKRLKDKGFNDKQIVDIFNIFTSSCRSCYDADSTCKCWDDS